MMFTIMSKKTIPSPGNGITKLKSMEVFFGGHFQTNVFNFKNCYFLVTGYSK
jgi:hypothetical protein